jgi:hypothetical protein
MGPVSPSCDHHHYSFLALHVVSIVKSDHKGYSLNFDESSRLRNPDLLPVATPVHGLISMVVFYVEVGKKHGREYIFLVPERVVVLE